VGQWLAREGRIQKGMPIILTRDKERRDRDNERGRRGNKGREGDKNEESGVDQSHTSNERLHCPPVKNFRS